MMHQDPNSKMSDYATRLCAARLDRVAYQIGLGRNSPDADSVHDLRVSIRRFLSGLREFRQFLPKREAKKVQARLRKIMDLSSEVRDRDIAMELARKAGGPEDSLLVQRLAKQRSEATDLLIEDVRRLHRQRAPGKWRDQLNL